ncbi:hypothetical protein [Sphingobium aquiterrae]|uniref:hypothetical protein n=1 Tax=Sphingobium aquiterrae TaxID=2038656 RepID=UPI003016F91A
MTELRHNRTAQDNAQNGAAGRAMQFVTVASPTPHEGVGCALRSAYETSPLSLPDDMAALMNRLNRL